MHKFQNLVHQHTFLVSFRMSLPKTPHTSLHRQTTRHTVCGQERVVTHHGDSWAWKTWSSLQDREVWSHLAAQHSIVASWTHRTRKLEFLPLPKRDQGSSRRQDSSHTAPHHTPHPIPFLARDKAADSCSCSGSHQSIEHSPGDPTQPTACAMANC